MGLPDPAGLLRHGPWTDRPDAAAQVQGLLEAGAIDDGQARQLEHFGRHGWLRLRAAVPQPLLQRAWADLEDALLRGEVLPGHLEGFGVFGSDQAVRLGIAPGRFAVHDLHNRSAAAVQAVSHDGVVASVQHLLRGEPVLMQSQWLRYGSGKGTHADYVYCPIEQPLATLTAWIAIDPVDADNGPLYVVPGSHRLALHRFEQGQLFWPHGEDRQRMLAYHAALDEACAQHGLAREVPAVQPGDVLLMHPRLAHGACRALNPARARRSLVLHLAGPQAYRSDHRLLAAGSRLVRAGRLSFYQPADVAIDAGGRSEDVSERW